MQINGKEIDIVKSHVESTNVEDCGSESICQRSPCLNQGECVNLSHNEYKCNCEPQFTGNRFI